MKTISIFSNTSLPAIKTIVMLMLAIALTDCAATTKNLSLLKVKSSAMFQQNQIVQSPNVRIEKDLIQADFEGKVRSSLSSSPFNTAIWSSNCDCR